MRSFISFCFFLSLIFFSSCGESYEFVGKQFVQPDKDHLQEDSLTYDSIAKRYFSRLSKPGSVGLFTSFQLPLKNMDKPLWVVFEGRARSNYPFSHATITVVGTNEKKETLCWNSCFLRYHFTSINKWCHFKDSIFLTSKLNFTTYDRINTFAYLGQSPGEHFDIDSLTVTIQQVMGNI